LVSSKGTAGVARASLVIARGGGFASSADRAAVSMIDQLMDMAHRRQCVGTAWRAW
jgi:hypothetical protein